MVHVDDLVKAIDLVEEKGKSGKVYIVTDGKTYSTREIYEILCDLLIKKVPKWRVPYSFFYLGSYVSKNFKYKVSKLFGDEVYYSTEIESSTDESQIEYKLDSVYGEGSFSLKIYETDFFLADLDPDSDFQQRQKYFSNQHLYLYMIFSY